MAAAGSRPGVGSPGRGGRTRVAGQVEQRLKESSVVKSSSSAFPPHIAV